MIAKTAISKTQYKETTGVPANWGDQNYIIRERISARSTLGVNGMWSGWSGSGPKAIVPAKAGAKLSSRLLGNQNPHKIFDLVKAYIDSISPQTVRVNVLEKFQHSIETAIVYLEELAYITK